ncbi:MBL fold metallo-hydrolase [soil metagenome]
MRVIAWRGGPYDNGTYVVVDERREAILVDPAMGERAALAAVRDNGLRLLEIMNTHGHPDHVFANAGVKEATRARLAIHRADAYRLALDSSRTSFPVPPSEPDDLIEEGPVSFLREVEIVALHTPGHTEGSTCFHLPRDGVLFSGDVLFAGAVGRVDLPGGDADQMDASLRRLASLPPETRVYPGHGPATKIGAELPWLRGFSAA